MRVGIDLGGTKIEAIALDPSGSERGRVRVPTPKDDYAAIVEAIATLVEKLETQVGARATVGVGIPGVISPATGLVKNANTVCLIGKPLDQDLARRLGREVRLANDANCFTLSEAADGAGAPRAGENTQARIVFGVILGTGTGGGIAVDRQVLTGANSIAGEWGHNPLPWPRETEVHGPPCYCGRKGCIETYLSGPGLARDHHKETGEQLVAAQIVERAARGDVAAEATLQRYEERLARSLASIMNVIDPHVIVLGGGLSKIERLYTNVPKLLGPYIFSDLVATRLVPPQHGDSSGVRGAAWLWPVASRS